jgi:hypothetical protein
MIINSLTNWFQSYRQASTSSKLRHKLINLVHGRPEIAQRLIALEKRKHPGKSELWYLEKVIYDLKRDA